MLQPTWSYHAHFVEKRTDTSHAGRYPRMRASVIGNPEVAPYLHFFQWILCLSAPKDMSGSRLTYQIGEYEGSRQQPFLKMTWTSLPSPNHSQRDIASS